MDRIRKLIIFGIQIERKKNHNKGIRSNIFAENDCDTLKMMISIVMVKLNILMIQSFISKNIKFLSNFIGINSYLLEARSPSNFYSLVRKFLPSITNYSDCCIIFNNIKEQDLFFVGDISHSGSELNVKFPRNLGISGIVLNKKEIYLGLKGNNEINFLQDIDNIITLPMIKNFAFLPLFDSKKQVVGILQLYNKKDKMDSSELSKLYPYCIMVGICVRNMFEMSKACFITGTVYNKIPILKYGIREKENE